MKYFLIPFLFLMLTVSCKQKVLSGDALNKKLVETMQNFLDSKPHPGTVFTVKDVTYYTEMRLKSYDCQFHVRMLMGQKDTLGTMLAVISNDFKTVDRKR